VQVCAPIRHGAHFHEKYLYQFQINHEPSLTPVLNCAGPKLRRKPEPQTLKVQTSVNSVTSVRAFLFLENSGKGREMWARKSPEKKGSHGVHGRFYPLIFRSSGRNQILNTSSGDKSPSYFLLAPSGHTGTRTTLNAEMSKLQTADPSGRRITEGLEAF
jgi:hypothetical protein